MAKEAGLRAQGYVIERAFTEYRIKYKTYPADLNDLLERIPDPDGTLAAALSNLDPQVTAPALRLPL